MGSVGTEVLGEVELDRCACGGTVGAEVLGDSDAAVTS